MFTHIMQSLNGCKSGYEGTCREVRATKTYYLRVFIAIHNYMHFDERVSPLDCLLKV